MIFDGPFQPKLFDDSMKKLVDDFVHKLGYACLWIQYHTVKRAGAHNMTCCPFAIRRR